MQIGPFDVKGESKGRWEAEQFGFGKCMDGPFMEHFLHSLKFYLHHWVVNILTL